MAPPVLGDEQINCGPCFNDQQIAGRWLTRNTPFGTFDVIPLAAELGSDQAPDVVVCHVDCGFCLRPVNLSVFRCPVILLAADSHWGEHAISELVTYAASESFTRVVLLYDRHHADFYRAAGIQNLHWFPAFTFAHDDARIHAAITTNPARGAHLALVGKVGYHFRRQRLFSALINARVPLAWRQIRQSEAIAHYASSLIGLNAAMNGDLNLRVFETIAGGAMLLTDRLAPAAGLDDLLIEGKEKVSYDNAADLVEKARYFLAHPDEARAIGIAGHNWFQTHFSEKRRRKAFHDLVFNGVDLPEFALPTPPASRVFFDHSAAIACDLVNELHRQQETVTVIADASVPTGFDELVSVLPRARVIRSESTAKPDVRVTFAEGKFTAVALAAPKPAPTPAQKIATEARHHLDAGDVQGALEKAQRVLAIQPQNAEALLVMTELAADVGNRTLADKMLATARRFDPTSAGAALLQWHLENSTGPRQPARLMASAWKAYESLDFGSCEKYLTMALHADATLADAYYLTALLHGRLRPGAASDAEKLNRQQLEITALQRACELAPARVELNFLLALRLRDGGSTAGAIRFYERTTELEPHNATAWLGLGEAHLERNDYSMAADAFAEGLRCAPDHALLKQAFTIAEEQTNSPSDRFLARFFATQAERSDCPHTSLDNTWQNFARAPLIGPACIRTLATETQTIPYAETIRLLISAGAAGVIADNAVTDYPELPARTVLMAYQPWFNLDTRRLVSTAFDHGTLLVLLDDEVIATQSTDTPEFEVTAENFRTLTHRGVSLWTVSSHRLALTLGTLPADISLADSRHATAITEVFSQAIALIDRVAAYCDFYKPSAVLMAQGYDLLSAVLRHTAVRRGLRAIAIENIFHSERLLWDDTSGIAVNRNQAKNHYWRYRDFISPEVAEHSTATFLNSIATVKTTEHQSPAATLPARADDGVRTITYLAQVSVDSSVLFGMRGFASQVEVIASLARYAADHGHRLLVKLHPKESPHFPDPSNYYRRLTARSLEKHPGFQAARAALGDRLLVDEENTFNTYDLIRQADVCVTINSQSGLEAALLGREVVLCGDAFYGQLGFTHEVTDGPSLDFTLKRVLDENLRINSGSTARTFFHVFTELYCVPKTVESIVDLLGARPAFHEFKETELIPVQNELILQASS